MVYGEYNYGYNGIYSYSAEYNYGLLGIMGL